jgi:nitrate/TMAO reductase-like tetraheme cytochrome c subunit
MIANLPGLLLRAAVQGAEGARQLHVDTPAPGDTMTVFSPPRDITTFARLIRWFFSVPQWIEIAGAVLAGIIAVIALVVLWRQRLAVYQWARTKHLTTPIFWKIVIGACAGVVLLAMAGAGGGFFVYSQNNNQFCLACHTLHDEVYQRFQQSKHHTVANLRCHDCHDEPLWQEARQVVYWVIDRPKAVGPHAAVPREVCAKCHIKDRPDSTWQRIVATAGHSIHVLSDTAKALKVECITCHGVTAHRFKPVAQTCQQSGCHTEAKIQLGKMSGQTMLHCTVCHQFTAPVRETNLVALARDSLVPTQSQCLKCHGMQQRLATFVPEKDPHEARCGSCHNPHRQTTPKQAAESCANAGCHDAPDKLTPFHRGLHKGGLSNCMACHEAHTWKVRGTQCLDCHKGIYGDSIGPPRRRLGHDR